MANNETLTATQALTPEPTSRAEVHPWFKTVSTRNRDGQCWRCGLDLDDIDGLGRDTDHWTLHYVVQGRSIGSQSCCTDTANRFEAILDQYFDIVSELAT